MATPSADGTHLVRAAGEGRADASDGAATAVARHRLLRARTFGAARRRPPCGRGGRREAQLRSGVPVCNCIWSRGRPAAGAHNRGSLTALGPPRSQRIIGACGRWAALTVALTMFLERATRRSTSSRRFQKCRASPRRELPRCLRADLSLVIVAPEYAYAHMLPLLQACWRHRLRAGCESDGFDHPPPAPGGGCGRMRTGDRPRTS